MDQDRVLARGSHHPASWDLPQVYTGLKGNLEKVEINKKVLWVSVTFHVCQSVIPPAQKFLLFFVDKKRNFHVMRHGPLNLKLKKIERKVTESQKIKNMLAKIWTFWKVQISLQAC